MDCGAWTVFLFLQTPRWRALSYDSSRRAITISRLCVKKV